jgi:NAD(P)-dependent dehydrogenase (short-subunit alcohol dehydrogenase family)
MKAIALVTGASGGIGHAVARQLHARGCLVAAVGRDAGRLADVEATLRIAADTTTPEGAGRQYPLGGVQTAAQVADAMAWLLSDGAARITGQVIAVDGGFTTVRPLVK